jgi:hypothetical protein
MTRPKMHAHQCATLSRDELSRDGSTERGFCGQCYGSNTTLESTKLIAILISRFQIVLNLLCKRSKNCSKQSQQFPSRAIIASTAFDCVSDATRAINRAARDDGPW